MYSYSKELKGYQIQFVIAFDKLNEQRRKLFNILKNDSLISFSDKKNICQQK